jgi:hypothetical protein
MANFILETLEIQELNRIYAYNEILLDDNLIYVRKMNSSRKISFLLSKIKYIKKIVVCMHLFIKYIYRDMVSKYW